jgi:predicted hydrolase (HD superfamily)
VRKKLKDRSFAAKVERHEVTAGAELLGVDLSEHVAFVIAALRPHADELGLGGSA